MPSNPQRLPLTPQQIKIARRKRWIYFISGFFVWACLAGWTFSAFFQHLQEMAAWWPSYGAALYGEIGLLRMLWLECFDTSIRVRKLAAIAIVAMTLTLAAHSGGLQGLKDGQKAQAEKESRLPMLSETAGKLIASINGSHDGQTARERRQQNRDQINARSKIANDALSEIKTSINNRDKAINSYGVFPEWYYRGWMYIGIFCLTTLFGAFPTYAHINRQPEDEDRNFSGTADIKEFGSVVMDGATYHLDGAGNVVAGSQPSQSPQVLPRFQNGVLVNAGIFSSDQLASMGIAADGRPL